MLTAELKKGSAEFLILAVLEHEPKHGYEISKLIEQRSKGVLSFHVASLYPLLYRMEKRRWIAGRWVEQEGLRRRRYYRVLPVGAEILEQQRESWKEFARAIGQVVGIGVRYA